ncbi:MULTISPECIES: hypothetical protein [unclassified Bilifractor]|uniref:hypothetical protein n=1 Tax=unclassified Bilifractor TaxID=2815795 RepID=UPI003F93443D
MAYIIIKSDERRADEEKVCRSFGVSGSNSEGREACEVIAARSREALEQGRREGGIKSWS